MELASKVHHDEVKSDRNLKKKIDERTTAIQIERNGSEGSFTSSAPVKVEWSRVSFVVESGRKLLDNVSGSVSPGEMLAVMGPSGSGKTTLLDFIADRVDKTRKGRSTAGWVRFNGSERTFGDIGGYVPQHDALVGVLTVRETLTYATMLSFIEGSGSSRDVVVRRAIESMGLESCADTKVGTIFAKGISGGQKRRLSMAIALIANPSVMILDEPTSGLDSASAFAVMGYLKKLTKRGHTVMITIHQPSSELWSLFDKVSFLVSGRHVYFGPAGKDVIGYFGSAGYALPPMSNPADFIMTLINVDFPNHADVDALVKRFASQEAKEQVTTSAQKDEKNASNGRDHVVDQSRDARRPSWLSRFVTLSRRNVVEQMRDPGILGVRLAMYSMLALMVGFMFFDVGSDRDDSSIRERISIIFYVAAFMVFMSVAVLPFFMMQREVFVQERANNMYGVSEFVLSRFLISLPGVFLIALTSSVFVVLPSGLNGFGVYLLNLYISLLVAEGFMNLIASCMPHFIIGIALAAGIFGFSMLCEGFFIVKDDIPPWFIWGYYASFHTYSFRVFMFNEFDGVNDFENNVTGTDILKTYSADNVNVGQDLGILFAFLGFFQAMFTYVLYRHHTGKR